MTAAATRIAPLLIILCLILFFSSFTASVTLQPRAHFSKYSDDELEQYLKDRGIPCIACTRRQLINLSHESQHLPLIKYKPREAENTNQKPQFTQIDPSDPNYDTMVEKMTDKEKIKKHQKMVEQLQEQGFDTSQVMKPQDDFDDLLRKAREIRETQEREKEEKESAMREERRRRREERRRRAKERQQQQQEQQKEEL